MTNPKISVIIPIYNVEDYLEEFIGIQVIIISKFVPTIQDIL